ncbi:MAG: amidohydrolase [Clostridia bacterium]|nr:amidohydrolase [Clostridia bacterium]
MYKIFDVHTHTYPEAIAEKAVTALGKFYNFVPEGKGIYRELEQIGADAHISGFLLFSVATNAHQVQKVNDGIAAQVRQSRAAGFSTVGFAGIHQDYPDFASELDRITEMGLRGVKIHPDIQGINIDDPRMMPLYAEMEKRKLPLYVHMGDNRPQYRFSTARRLVRVLERYPDLSVVAAHLGGYQAWMDAPMLVAYPQVLFDTSSAIWAMTADYAGELIHILGTDRVMFGTDYPVKCYESELSRFFAVPLTEEERRKILYDNAARFLDLNNEDKYANQS